MSFNKMPLNSMIENEQYATQHNDTKHDIKQKGDTQLNDNQQKNILLNDTPHNMNRARQPGKSKCRSDEC
jgi:hypothetical protein